MIRRICSAPGKIFLGGEYAVLGGAEAVVAAVNRRAVASTMGDKCILPPILSAVHEEVLGFLRDIGNAKVELEPIQVKSEKFHIRKKKLGLGSSAAVTVAACGAFFELAGLTIDEHRMEIMKTATAAHKRIQGGKGSGADVAASALGGALIFSMDGRIEPISVNNLQVAVVWSGRAASTSELIGRIEAFAKRDPVGHKSCFDNLNEQAAMLARAFRASDQERIIEAAGDYGRAMDVLGRASKAPIVTNEHKLVAKLALDSGGAAKPSGAGGGDIAVAFFKSRDSLERFNKDCLRHGLTPLDISIGAQGLKRDS